MHPHPIRSPYAALALIALGGALSLAACGSDQPASSPDPGTLPTGFGGAGGVITATPSGGAGLSGGTAGAGQAGEMTTLPNVCLDVAKGQVARIDDFEDGDSVALPEPGREGYWFTVHDTTTGSIVPDTDFIPAPGGANGTQRAAHVQASGFSDWGALFEVSLTYLSDGVHCPYNASSFAGVRLYLRGSGVIRAALVTPATQEKEYGGNCDTAAGMVCFDTHTTTLPLNAQWTLYELPWSAFKQRGFGAPVVLRTDQVMAVQFAFDTPDLPIDFWLDEVSFWDGQKTPPVDTGEGGAGGTGGDSNSAGAGNSAGASSSAGAGGDSSVEPSEAGAGGAAGHSAP